MKASLASLVLTLAVLSPAAENSAFYLSMRNNDLATLSKLVRDSGPDRQQSIRMVTRAW